MKLTDRDLVSIIQSHRRDSLGAEDGDLSNDRAKAMDHYHGRPYGNEVEGRSGVVSTDLRDTVEWIVPQWLKICLSGKKVCEFEPMGPEECWRRMCAGVGNWVLNGFGPFAVIRRDDGKLVGFLIGFLSQTDPEEAYIHFVGVAPDHRGLPPALVLRHPGYLRPMHGVAPPGGLRLHIVAFDLARGPDGRWRVIDTHTETPAGIGYALANRMVHTNVAGDL